MTIGVIGAGTMGTGIAIACANGGYPVTVVDADGAALARCRNAIGDNYESLRRKGRIDEAEIGVRRDRIRLVTDFEAVAPCSIVIEAVFESLQLKQDVFARLWSTCDERTILATNTSTLDVDAIASEVRDPQRCIGMHFFSPAHVMKLVEVIRGRQTAAATIEAICTLARRLGKTPIVVANADGFVGNRMLLGYRREAEFLVLHGARPRDVDAALEDFGFALGPFAVSDLAGIDIGVRAKHEREARGFKPSFNLTRLTDELVAAGRLGRKSGQGYYRYSGDASAPDTLFESIVAAERTRLGIAVRTISPAEIVERCVFALVNEAGRILEEGVAASPEDIDAIWRLGYGFPAARGGPLQYAESLGFDQIAARIRIFAEGDREFWHVSPYVERRAAAADGAIPRT